MKGRQKILSEDEQRLVKAKADKAEIEVSQKKNELIDLKIVEKEWNAMALAFRNKMLTIPTALAAELAEMNNPREVEAALKRAINDALSELSKGATASEP